MPLEILEPRHESAVEHGTQVIEFREQPLLGVTLWRLHPRDEIAAHFGCEALVRAAPDFRGPQVTRGMQLGAARAQLREQRVVDEMVRDAEPALGELIDQARRRERSGRRLDFDFASGRRLLRALAGLRRLDAGFFGGHNMVPRHCGEPQRQA
jgi:hypothetical protein